MVMAPTSSNHSHSQVGPVEKNEAAEVVKVKKYKTPVPDHKLVIKEIHDEFDGLIGNKGPLVLSFKNHLLKTPPPRDEFAFMDFLQSVQPVVPDSPVFEGRILLYHQQSNSLLVELDTGKCNNKGKDIIPVRLPGMDFFPKTPFYKYGVVGMFEYFRNKGTPLDLINVKVTRLRLMEDGYIEGIVEFADGRTNHPKRLDELWAYMWGKLCKVEVEPRKRYKGKVTYIEETGEIYFIPLPSIYPSMWSYLGKLSFKDLLDRKLEVKDCSLGQVRKLELYNWTAGLERVYVALSSLDSKFGRCKIVEVSEKDQNEVLVQFIDYGNKEWVGRRELFEAEYANAAFAYMPSLAVGICAVKIASFKPSGMDRVRSTLGKGQELDFEICRLPVYRKQSGLSIEETIPYLQARIYRPEVHVLLNLVLDCFGVTNPGNPLIEVESEIADAAADAVGQ